MQYNLFLIISDISRNQEYIYVSVFPNFTKYDNEYLENE